MLNKIKKSYHKLGIATATGIFLATTDAQAQQGSAANNFGSIANNINTSISSLPGLITALAYLFGVLLAVLGILKIKDHVENPSQTPLKDGVIRLIIGGLLFALPILLEAMLNTMGSGSVIETAKLKKVEFGTN